MDLVATKLWVGDNVEDEEEEVNDEDDVAVVVLRQDPCHEYDVCISGFFAIDLCTLTCMSMTCLRTSGTTPCMCGLAPPPVLLLLLLLEGDSEGDEDGGGAFFRCFEQPLVSLPLPLTLLLLLLLLLLLVMLIF